jgi:hypothetical protein
MKINKNHYKMGYFTPREKIDDLSKFNWVKLDKYLVGLDDINYKMYVFTPRDNFYTSQSMYFTFDESTKIKLFEDDINYLIELRTKNLIQFTLLTTMLTYFNRIKILNSICS